MRHVLWLAASCAPTQQSDRPLVVARQARWLAAIIAGGALQEKVIKLSRRRPRFGLAKYRGVPGAFNADKES